MTAWAPLKNRYASMKAVYALCSVSDFYSAKGDTFADALVVYPDQDGGHFQRHLFQTVEVHVGHGYPIAAILGHHGAVAVGDAVGLEAIDGALAAVLTVVDVGDGKGAGEDVGAAGGAYHLLQNIQNNNYFFWPILKNPQTVPEKILFPDYSHENRPECAAAAVLQR